MLIGLHGDSRSGKDETARVLKPLGFERRAFGDRLREVLLYINPWLVGEGEFGRDTYDPWRLADLVREAGWDAAKAEDFEVTEYMIRLGQGVRDLIHEDAWTWRIFDDRPANLVITDLRQPNEVTAIRERGGLLWKIIRPGTKPRGMDRLLEHVQFDATIHNDGTLEDLETTVKKVLGAWRHP